MYGLDPLEFGYPRTKNVQFRTKILFAHIRIAQNRSYPVNCSVQAPQVTPLSYIYNTSNTADEAKKQSVSYTTGMFSFRPEEFFEIEAAM
jgi:hypothetical protein